MCCVCVLNVFTVCWMCKYWCECVVYWCECMLARMCVGVDVGCVGYVSICCVCAGCVSIGVGVCWCGCVGVHAQGQQVD